MSSHREILDFVSAPQGVHPLRVASPSVFAQTVTVYPVIGFSRVRVGDSIRVEPVYVDGQNGEFRVADTRLPETEFVEPHEIVLAPGQKVRVVHHGSGHQWLEGFGGDGDSGLETEEVPVKFATHEEIKAERTKFASKGRAT